MNFKKLANSFSGGKVSKSKSRKLGTKVTLGKAIIALVIIAIIGIPLSVIIWKNSPIEISSIETPSNPLKAFQSLDEVKGYYEPYAEKLAQSYAAGCFIVNEDNLKAHKILTVIATDLDHVAGQAFNSRNRTNGCWRLDYIEIDIPSSQLNNYEAILAIIKKEALMLISARMINRDLNWNDVVNVESYRSDTYEITIILDGMSYLLASPHERDLLDALTKYKFNDGKTYEKVDCAALTKINDMSAHGVILEGGVNHIKEMVCGS